MSVSFFCVRKFIFAIFSQFSIQNNFNFYHTVRQSSLNSAFNHDNIIRSNKKVHLFGTEEIKLNLWLKEINYMFLELLEYIVFISFYSKQ